MTFMHSPLSCIKNVSASPHKSVDFVMMNIYLGLEILLEIIISIKLWRIYSENKVCLQSLLKS